METTEGASEQTYNLSDCSEERELKAAETADVKFLDFCINDYYGKVDLRDSSNETLAHLGAGNGHLNVVEWCLRLNKNFFLEAVDAKNNTLLHAAVRGGSVKVLDHVLQQKSTLLYRMNGEGFTVLHEAAALGRTDAVARLVDHYKMWPSQTTATRNNTAALLAAKFGHAPVLNWLLEHDSDLAHAVAECDYNLLHWAAYNRLVNETRALCEKYRVQYRDNCDGDFPMHIAYRTAHYRTADVLADACHASELERQTKTPRNTIAHEAALIGIVEPLKQLDLRNKTYVNLENDRGQTPIMLAAKYANFYVVRYLLGRGAFVHLKDKKANTILHYTACDPHLLVLKRLWSTREEIVTAHLNATNEAGESCVYAAAKCGNFPFVEYVCEKGADPNIPTLEFRTALGVAVERDDLKMAEYLLQREDNPRRRDKYERRPWHFTKSEEMKKLIRLHFPQFTLSTNTTDSAVGGVNYECGYIMEAAVQGDLDHVQFCVLNKNREYINVHNGERETLAHVSAVNGHFKLVEWLLENEIRLVDRVDYLNNTLLHAAAQGGSVEVVHLVADKNRSLLQRKNVDGHSALHVAVVWRHQLVVVGLVEHWGMRLNETTSVTGNTAALVAAKHNSYRILEWILEKDASLADVVGECNNSLLHWSAARDNTVMADLLCRVYHVRSMNNCDGDFPIHFAFRHSNFPLVEVLDQTCHGNLLQERWKAPFNTVAHEAAESGNLSVLRYLDSKNKKTAAYAELENDLTQTPLFLAVRANQLEAVDFLVTSKRAAVHGIDKNGNTVLHMTACNPDQTVLQYLQTEQPDLVQSQLDKKNHAGETVLYRATTCDNVRLARYLIYFLNADTEVFASDNTTAFMVAVMRDNFEMARLMLGHGVRYEKRPVNGSELELWEYAKTERMRDFVENSLRCPMTCKYVPPQMSMPLVSDSERERRMVHRTNYVGAGVATSKESRSATASSAMERGTLNDTLLLVVTLVEKLFGWRLIVGSSGRNLPSFPREELKSKMDPLAIEAVDMGEYFEGFDDENY